MGHSDVAVVQFHTENQRYLEDRETRLGSRVLGLHVIQIRYVILPLVIILRQASHVGSASDGGERASSPQSVGLGVRHAGRTAVGGVN